MNNIFNNGSGISLQIELVHYIDTYQVCMLQEWNCTIRYLSSSIFQVLNSELTLRFANDMLTAKTGNKQPTQAAT